MRRVFPCNSLRNIDELSKEERHKRFEEMRHQHYNMRDAMRASREMYDDDEEDKNGDANSSI